MKKKQINAGHELKIIALEQEVSLSIKLASGALVRLKGIIDRVDYFDGQLRIIDYKTGKIEGSDLKIKQWDTFLVTTTAAAFQLLTCLNVCPAAACTHSRYLCFTKHP